MSRPQARQQGRLATCLQRTVTDSNNQEAAMELLQSWLASAIELGAYLLDGPRQQSFGVEAWL
ncbi:MAG: VOC family protein, partial [Cyanobacteria bacterium]|nr:VOC family protein [Cyanobacteriota bacterium]